MAARISDGPFKCGGDQVTHNNQVQMARKVLLFISSQQLKKGDNEVNDGLHYTFNQVNEAEVCSVTW